MESVIVMIFRFFMATISMTGTVTLSMLLLYRATTTIEVLLAWGIGFFQVFYMQYLVRQDMLRRPNE